MISRSPANLWLLLAFTCMLLGCSRLSTDYGKSKGLGKTSLNGFGALRTAFEQAGASSRDISRFSERVLRTDAIVWTPQSFAPIETKVTQWFERWLATGNKTLVYVVPDSGSEADYWTDAAKLASPEQRLEYRKRAAKSINQRMTWRLNRVQQPSNGWFRVEPLKHRQYVTKLEGSWQEEVGGPGGELGGFVEFAVIPYDKDQAPNATTTPTFLGGPTGPGTQQWYFPEDVTTTNVPIKFTRSLTTGDGNSIVTELQSSNWNGSRIIVVAGGSLLTNYGLTKPMNQRLAAKIIKTATPTGKDEMRVGFLSSSANIPVSEKKPGAPVVAGMEMLTVWPISLVTMHGVILGLVICLMLYPIFGRPKRITNTKQSDFGHHLDAVAALMIRAKGEQYARQRISDYMKRVVGETVGPWVLPDPPRPETTKTLPILTSQRLQRMKSSAADAVPPPSLQSEPETLDILDTIPDEANPAEQRRDANLDNDKENH
jgi:hypothetical protein